LGHLVQLFPIASPAKSNSPGTLPSVSSGPSSQAFGALFRRERGVVTNDHIEVDVPAGALGMVLEQVDAYPSLRVQTITALESGGENPLINIIPVGAQLLMVNNFDTKTMNVEDAGRILSRLHDRPRKLLFQVTSIAHPDADTPGARFTYKITMPSGPLGMAVDERETGPTIFVTELRPVTKGKTNPLASKVPLGAYLISINGHDTTSCASSAANDKLHLAMFSPQLELEFQVINPEAWSRFSRALKTRPILKKIGKIDPQNHVEIQVPPGPLGLVLEECSSVYLRVFVARVDTTSPMAKQVPDGAFLTEVNGYDTSSFSLEQVGELLHGLAQTKLHRVLVFKYE
jgi:hypothetical protein